MTSTHLLNLITRAHDLHQAKIAKIRDASDRKLEAAHQAMDKRIAEIEAILIDQDTFEMNVDPITEEIIEEPIEEISDADLLSDKKMKIKVSRRKRKKKKNAQKDATAPASGNKPAKKK